MFCKQQTLDKKTHISTANSNVTTICLAMPSKGMGKCGVDVLIYLSSYGLFNDADSSVYVVLNGTVIVYDELERLQS